jgi:hypothetical protein
MKIMYSIGGAGKSRLYLDARVHYVTPGTMIIEGRRPPLRIPALTLQYDLETLIPISAIVSQMARRKREPEVYIWDEGASEPEVAVFLRAVDPEKDLLDKVSGSVGESLNEALIEHGCEQVFTVAEVNLVRDDVARLIRDYGSCGSCIVDVREVGSDIRDDQPLRRFLTKRLYRKRPEFTI